MTVSSYSDNLGTIKLVHRFFEGLIPYFYPPEGGFQWDTREFDNFKFIAHELFLYAIACFIKNERFFFASYLLSTQYLDNGNRDGQGLELRPFRIFYQEIQSLHDRNTRLNLQNISLQAKMIKERCKHTLINFDRIMETDYILCVRSLVDPAGEKPWYPTTLIYSLPHRQNFETIAKLASRAYFEEFKSVLSVDTTDDLSKALMKLDDRHMQLVKWHFERPIQTQVF